VLYENFFSKSLGNKLTALFLFVSITPIIILGIISYTNATSSLKNQQESKLSAILKLKKYTLEDYYKNALIDMKQFAESKDVKELYTQLLKYHNDMNVSDSGPFNINTDRYKKICETYGKNLEAFKEMKKYYDIFIICSEHGHVMYTVSGEADLGTSLKYGPYKTSNLSKLFAKVIQQEDQAIVDFEPYAPSNNAPASFAGFPIRNERGEMIGVMAVQLSIDILDGLMSEKTGLGKTGGTYLVGQDYLMRCNTDLDHVHNSMTQSFASNLKMETSSVKSALKGETGIHTLTLKIKGKNQQILSCFNYIDIGDFRWAILGDMDYAEFEAPAISLRNKFLIISIILAIIVFIISRIISNSIVNPIINISKIVSKVANGDLTETIPVDDRKDEVGTLASSFSIMFSNLREQIKETLEGTNIIAGSTSEISATTNQFASSTSEISASVNETVTSLKEVKQTTNASSDKASSMATRAKDVVITARNGDKAVEETIEAMNNIQSQMISIAESIVGLSEKSQSIGEIISSVDDLAEQSRLLAVNAAIEAVKAGEQGKGFSVVAGEIKSLAEQSKQSTAQIRKILTDIQKATSTAVMATEQGNKAVENGVSKVNKTGDAIKLLGENVNESTRAAIQIEATSKQQVAGIDQIFTAMESINTAIDQNAEGAKELGNAANNLEALGRKLMGVVDKYKV